MAIQAPVREHAQLASQYRILPSHISVRQQLSEPEGSTPEIKTCDTFRDRNT